MKDYILIFLVFGYMHHGFSKVDPPNYDFSVNKFQLFMPGKKLSDIEKVYKFKELTFKSSQFITYKFYVEHIRYRFPIFVQFKDNIVTDFFARLPQYFLHDIFHQSLINRIGPQDVYKKVDEHAVYVWKNKNGLKHSYSGTCTITCFPLYYAVRKVKNEFKGSFLPLIKKFNAQ
jgi:hypothetical protein